MDAELAQFLEGQAPASEETQMWGGGAVPLLVRSYVCREMPAAEHVTSVRGFVFQNEQVLVIKDGSGKDHLTPGGRCEAGETFEETFRREVKEESGWTLLEAQYLGFIHFHHLAPKPEAYRYAHPDFLQVLYRGEAGEYRVWEREIGGYEIDADFQPIVEAARHPSVASVRSFLTAALAARTSA